MFKEGMIVKDNNNVIIEVKQVKDMFNLTRNKSFIECYELHGIQLDEKLKPFGQCDNELNYKIVIHTPNNPIDRLKK